MPTLGAAAVVLQNYKVLLIKRRDVEVWALPGGGLDANESVAQAAIREVAEETGIQIELTRLIGIYSRPSWRAGGDHCVLFAARPLTHTIAIQPEEVIEAGFFLSSELPEPLAWWVKKRINDALDGVTGNVRLQDAVWPFEEEENWGKRLEESSIPSSALYAEYFSVIGPRGDVVEVLGASP